MKTSMKLSRPINVLKRGIFFSREHSLKHVRSTMTPGYTICHLKELEGVVNGIETG